MAGMQQIKMKTALGQVPGQEKPGSKNKASQVPGQKKPRTYSGQAEVPERKNQELFDEGYSTGPDQYGKSRNFFTVGSGDAGQGPVENILLVFKEGLEVGCWTGPF